MAKQAGMGMRAFVAGYQISGDIGAINTIKASRASLDVTDIEKSAHQRISGLRDGELSFNVFYNVTAGQEHTALKGLPTADIIAMVHVGTAVGDAVAALNAKQINYDWNRTQDGALLGTVQCLPDDFGLEWCESLTAGLRTDTGATNGASIDGQNYGLVGASSAFGAAAWMESTSFTGTSCTLTVQDSADNSTFATITGLQFTAITAAPASERKETSLTATIRRYVRVASSGTFNPCSFAVAFIRYLTARDP